MKFYKGVLLSHLNDNYTPGTVTTEFMIAFTWYERIGGSLKRGASRHLKRGKACIIELEYDYELLDHNEFQRKDVHEHERKNCWTSIIKNKAQINTVCEYRILSDDEIDKLFTI